MTTKKDIETILETKVRPRLALHAGNIELVGVEGGVVSVRFLGTCDGCPMATMTLKMGVEALLKEEDLGITEVKAVN